MQADWQVAEVTGLEPVTSGLQSTKGHKATAETRRRTKPLLGARTEALTSIPEPSIFIFDTLWKVEYSMSIQARVDPCGLGPGICQEVALTHPAGVSSLSHQQTTMSEPLVGRPTEVGNFTPSI